MQALHSSRSLGQRGVFVIISEPYSIQVGIQVSMQALERIVDIHHQELGDSISISSLFIRSDQS